MNEIEIKWLIYENGKHFSSAKFWEIAPAESIKELRSVSKEIGVECNQIYFEQSDGIKIMSELGMSPPFVPDTYRLRPNKFTIKSGSGYTRKELESPPIHRDFYDKWVHFGRDNTVKKHRIRIGIDIGLDEAGIFEIDVYDDRDLIVCELEIPDEKYIEQINEQYRMGEDISKNHKYKNRYLAFHP